jgi:hypothetical protein
MTDWRSALPGPAEQAARRQAILNERPIPPRHLQRVDRTPIPVTARIIWQRDGQELIDTRALDWVGRDVLVEILDRRWRVTAVWIDAGDVRRRDGHTGQVLRDDLRRADPRRGGPST